MWGVERNVELSDDFDAIVGSKELIQISVSFPLYYFFFP